jgi:hypothetical protein
LLRHLVAPSRRAVGFGEGGSFSDGGSSVDAELSEIIMEINDLHQDYHGNQRLAWIR